VASEHHTQRGFDRLVNFSDAVVAIAITLLVLPLTDVVTASRQDSVIPGAFELIGDNRDLMVVFALTFLITALFWLLHHRIFECLNDYDGMVIWLNILWLMLIVLLPFVSDLLQHHGFADGTGLVYCWLLAFLSLITGVIAVYALRHPRLLDHDVPPELLRGAARRAGAFAAFLLLVGLLSLVQPKWAQWAMLGLIVVSLATRYAHLPRRQPSS
jgi:uncharacterized membrane protein